MLEFSNPFCGENRYHVSSQRADPWILDRQDQNPSSFISVNILFTCINFALFCKSYVVELVRESFTTLILNIESNQGKSTPGELLNFLLSFISCNYHCELLNITVLPSKCETAKTTVANLLSLFYYMASCKLASLPHPMHFFSDRNTNINLLHFITNLSLQNYL